MDELVKQIIEVRKMARASLPQLRAEITDIIESKSVDERRIEHTIDDVLNLYEMGIGKKEFLRLNAYYKTVNPEGADFYRRAYENVE
jgi:hypothetical protein